MMMLPAAHALLDLQALAGNLAYLRRRAPLAKIMAVIKANAYGHGAIPVARALADADAFAVARVDEGVSLRDAGIRQRIAVLQGFINHEELFLHSHYDLEPVVHCTLQMEMLEAVVLQQPVSVWLKLDSGMHRLGFSIEEFNACHKRLLVCPSVRQPPYLMTHLANADELECPVTESQLDLFGSQVASLPGERSIANSAGLLAWGNALAEWVRPGIALYGVSPFPNNEWGKKPLPPEGRGVGERGLTTQQEAPDLNSTALPPPEPPLPKDGLKPVMTLRTRLIAIKPLKIGDAVGYGGDWVCSRPTRMGVAAIGYGDGYPRHARSGTPVLVRGRRVPLIGRVSMDMITLDLTECPEAEVGDAVTLWGEGLPVEEIARHADTIPYVLLCNVTPRVKRVICGSGF